MAERTYESITFEVGAVRTIPAGDTVNVISGANSTIDGATIRSTVQGSPAYLNFLDGAITVNNVTFRDIDASGGGQIDDTNGGVDEGGNSNILFPVTVAAIVPLLRLYGYIRAATLDAFLNPVPSGILVGTAGVIDVFSQGSRQIIPSGVVAASKPYDISFTRMNSENTTASNIFFLYD